MDINFLYLINRFYHFCIHFLINWIMLNLKYFLIVISSKVLLFIWKIFCKIYLDNFIFIKIMGSYYFTNYTVNLNNITTITVYCNHVYRLIN